MKVIILLFVSILITSAKTNAQRTIITIGDSNGASKQGWVNQLKSIRTQDSIFNYSISGNTIGFDNNGMEKLNTLKSVTSYLTDASKKSTTRRIDDVIILLGTNDCKKVFASRNDEVAQNLEQLILSIKKDTIIANSASQIYIVTPPPFDKDSVLIDKYKGGDERIRALLPQFMAIALRTNCQFIDIYHEVKPTFHQLTTDGIHLTAEGSKTIAQSISRFLDKSN